MNENNRNVVKRMIDSIVAKDRFEKKQSVKMQNRLNTYLNSKKQF